MKFLGINFKPFYLIGWQNEGKFWVKRGWMVRMPRKGQKNDAFQLRKKGSKSGKLDPGEENYQTFEEAVKAGNYNLRKKL